MPKISGSTGAASFGGTTILITNWSADVTADIIDTTDSGDSSWKTSLAKGWKSWTATCDGFQISGVADETIGGTAASLILTMKTSNTYTGNAIITGMTVNTDVAGTDAVKKTYTFQGTGALTLATA